MASLTIDQIEAAILTTLQADATLTGLCPTIAPYHGELEDEVLTLQYPYPALFVFFRDAQFLPLTNTREQEGDFTFSLLVATLQVAGSRIGQLGVSGGVAGSYAILQRVREVLRGSAVGLPTLPHFQLVSQTVIRMTRAMSIYDCQYVTRQVTIKLGE